MGRKSRHNLYESTYDARRKDTLPRSHKLERVKSCMLTNKNRLCEGVQCNKFTHTDLLSKGDDSCRSSSMDKRNRKEANTIMKERFIYLNLVGNDTTVCVRRSFHQGEHNDSCNLSSQSPPRESARDAMWAHALRPRGRNPIRASSYIGCACRTMIIYIYISQGRRER